MPRRKKSLTPQHQQILAAIQQLDITSEQTAITPTELLSEAKHLDETLFPKGAPNTSASAALMTAVYRAIKGLHRVKSNSGRGYKYFYNTEIDLVKNAPRRSPKKKVYPIGEVARRAAAIGLRKAKSVRPESTSAKYLIVKKTDGKFAGVVHDGVLFESLESFVAALNA